ncbi:glucokinase [Motiliproteus coralliicola]|uniref:Glucokinase n=1 Tax=Motiliproteus coralliicola TaxID=2283196 RepID=A0A369WS81_9GAMM|nr:glucokinase [Motiliproteus coralliicola]RDE24411.1 glucokinase [Motiliproteus coralliicola]
MIDTRSRSSLVADIGGTNARFALVEPGGLNPTRVLTLAVDDHSSIEAAIRAYLERVGAQLMPRQVCLAIACPTTRDRISMTNNGWSFSRIELQSALGLERLEIINDYAAQAHAIPNLDTDGLVQVGGGDAFAGQPLAMLGPGTGLGVGGLVLSEQGAVAVVTEGGHVDFAPANELEVDILRYLWRHHEHVSVERLLSGMGLVNLHQALAEIRGQSADELTPAQISSNALDCGDSLCLEVLECFCAMLGSVAGNTALTLGAQGGVYITGGIIPRMLDFFTNSQFRARFESKGRFRDYMAAIPTYVVTAEHPGLIGSAAVLKNNGLMAGQSEE